MEQKRAIKKRRALKREKKTLLNATANNSRAKKAITTRKRRRREKKFENQKLHWRRFGQLAEKSGIKAKKEKRRADSNHVWEWGEEEKEIGREWEEEIRRVEVAEIGYLDINRKRAEKSRWN